MKGRAMAGKQKGSHRRLMPLLGVFLGLAAMGSAPQSWYSPGVHRIEQMTRYDWTLDDRQVIVYPLALELDFERSETTVWLYVGGERAPGKTRYFCPRGASLRDGVRPTTLMLSRLEAAAITTRKGRGECVAITPRREENVQAQARTLYDTVGTWRLRGEDARPLHPGQVGLVFLGVPHREAPYLAVTFPFGEEILFSTRDLQ